jgi:hypothetical protein
MWQAGKPTKMWPVHHVAFITYFVVVVVVVAITPPAP